MTDTRPIYSYDGIESIVIDGREYPIATLRIFVWCGVHLKGLLCGALLYSVAFGAIAMWLLLR